ncbi:ABC-type bacteriocin/lantibiotic exporter, contains an N-terminal double-glycine peptidase domain [Filimonas lacunae]|uniref:ABC-type bacteriocin/lantibiotic exporter, contains an N-terminal double-glycine peptidase domain n=1 Tax=Filimonas lacunae TaxID=477680 RepID=A0A173MNH5_9BACT|nr:ATP-binding cassette domain-containing protein [Filimonas lacunae]BAV08928.1 HlyB/MsbA family ABC transporter [Filimonas lacunae]SIS64147.1 ABC-type bacteriocin/lantibiotic exporter, contains an N-terminal double-glycine peptidase domain [Filimonas lacunae]
MATDKISIGKSFLRFYNILRLDKKDVTAIYILAILAGLLQLSVPLGVQTIISFVMAGSFSTSIAVLIIMVVLGVLFNGLLQVRQLQVIEKMQQKIFLRYSFEFSDRLPKLNVEKLDSYYLPELVNRFFDTVSLQKGLEKLLLDLPAAVIQVLFGVLLLSFYHPVFIAFGALLLIIVIIILRLTSPRGLASALQASDYKYHVAAWLEETARVIRTFKYAKSTSMHIEKTDKLVSGYLDSRTRYFHVLLTQFWSLISFKVIITAAMLLVGAVLLVNQQINIGQFIAADIVILAIISSVEKIILSLDKVYDALVSVEKLGKIVDADTEEGGSIVLADNNKGVQVRFTDAGFSYPNGSKALEKVNLTVPAGTLVHIAGASGSGKSTLLRMLTGNYKNFTGSVLIDEVPVGNYNLDSLRSQTGILLSSQDIFQGTLLENITLGNAIAMEEITALAAKTGLDQFVRSNKEGYDVILDPTGKRLSHHVRQNILLVRALLGKHRLLLLEEPFAHLDEECRKQMLALIKSESNATVFIASEDESLSDSCHMVVRMNKGTIQNNPA